MTALSSSYGIIIDFEINTPGHRKNAIDGDNTTVKFYLKGEIELIGKLGGNDTSNIGTIPSASKYVSIKFSDRCVHIFNNEEI